MNISVALCTYNGESFLREQLDSIAGQTLLPNELVVCDDRSQDGTLAVVRAFAEQAPFPVRIHRNETNLGSTKNFEQAISLCQGEVIALSDQDDVWRPHKLGRLCEALKANPGAGYAFSDADLVDDRLQPLGRRLWDLVGFHGDLRELFTRGEQLRCFLRHYIVTGATMAFRRVVVQMAMPFPTSGRWIHDGWLALIASATGWPGVPVAEPLIAYRQHAAQQIGAVEQPAAGKGTKSLRRMYRELQEQQEALFRSWEEHGLQILAMQGRLQQLRQHHPGPPLDQSLRYLQAFETHFRARRRVLTSQVRGATRLRLIMAEALAGRYGEFSDSWRSVCRDLFL